MSISFETTVEKQWLLEKLKANRETHQKHFEAAHKGYIAAARKRLEKELAKLESGEVSSLYVHLTAPSDQTSMYDLAISMLEQHTVDNVTISASDYAQFVNDDWINQWLVSNAMYSPELSTAALEKGLELP